MSRLRVGLAAVVVAAALQLVAAAPSSAATLTTVGWNISKPHPGDTAVRYTWSFTTATAATLSKVTFTVPTGTAGASLTVVDAYGVPAGGTAALSGTTVTYTLASATSVAAAVKVLLAIDGFTNTATPGSYTSSVSTFNTTPAVVDGPTASAAVSLVSNATTAAVEIARSTIFTDNLTSMNFPMDPVVATDVTRPETLTVKSNSATGYALSISATTLGDGLGNTVPAVTAGVATGIASASFTANRWGYTATETGSSTLQGALTTVGNYVGYTTAGDDMIVSTGPTNGDTISLTHRVKINYGQEAGTYNSTISYLVVPSY
jgi:hypothetical protein